ncbi:MAG: class I SAM-dependent methyltransferase [Bacillus sp. (in: firmicutes)]
MGSRSGFFFNGEEDIGKQQSNIIQNTNKEVELLEWHNQAKEQWDSYARGWSDNARAMWDKGSRKDIVPFFSEYVPCSAKVIDIGCGDGYGTMKLHRAGYKVTGLDLSTEMIDLAKQRTAESSLPFAEGDMCDIPFADGVFDAVMAINSIEWTENPFQALMEVSRITKRGGKACFGILGPTAGPRKAHSYRSCYGEKVIMNSMLPWDFEQMALENGWRLIGEHWVEKKGAKKANLPEMPRELAQALSFMWLFMIEKQ